MNVDYYAVLTKAVAGKDSAARAQIYRDAHGLIRKSQLTREAVIAHAAALEDVIRRIDGDFATENPRSASEINEVLTSQPNWRPLICGAAAMVAIIAVTALLYGFVETKGFGVGGGRVTAAASKLQGTQDAIIADLKPGEDGGSTGEGLPFALQRQVVFYRTTVVPGSIVVDRENRFLYLSTPIIRRAATVSVLRRSA